MCGGAVSWDNRCGVSGGCFMTRDTCLIYDSELERTTSMLKMRPKKRVSMITGWQPRADAARGRNSLRLPASEWRNINDILATGSTRSTLFLNTTYTGAPSIRRSRTTSYTVIARAISQVCGIPTNIWPLEADATSRVASISNLQLCSKQ
jgi:hypothetical protein